MCVRGKCIYVSYFPFSSFLDFPVVLNHATEVKGKKVRVVWSSLLACPLKWYNVYYTEVLAGFGKINWTSVSVSSKETHYTLDLHCHKVYKIVVTATISSGETPLNLSSWWKVKTGQGTTSEITNVEMFIYTPRPPIHVLYAYVTCATFLTNLYGHYI